ncbi:methyl-accepting chemotaxis protein [Desulfovibrio inopinatus]|uniref:methyl-accepting chemotaxis protein n=1 Tax=Desulfovibrio inopinatus TaxID=102109 RepID=UPI00040F2951|nr:methyl-accepting chemotaxis protein [Desulfovibrio inopinatus]
MKFRSISIQLAVITLGIIAVFVGLLIWYVSTSTYTMAIDLEKQTLSDVAVSTTRVVESYVDNNIALAQSLSAQSGFQGALLSEYFVKDADKVMSEFLSGYKDLWAIALFDLEGNVVSGQNALQQKLGGESWAGRDFVQAIAQGETLYIGDSVQRQGASLVFVVAVPVRDLNGEPAGGIAVFSRFDNFTRKFVDSVAVGRTGYAFILDTKGRFIAHARKGDVILQSGTDLDYVQNASALDRGIVAYDEGGNESFMAVETIPGVHWKVCVTAQNSELSETPHHQRNILLVAGLILIFLLVVLLYYTQRRLVLGPLSVLEGYTMKVANGDLHAELSGHFRYELAQLATNLKHMVDELKAKLSFSQGVMDSVSSSFPCLVLDADASITFVNEQLLSLLGKTGEPTDYLDQNASEFFFGDRSRRPRSAQALDENRRVEGEMEVAMPDGSLHMLNVNATPLHDLDGNVAGAITLYFDLTTHREQEARIVAQNEKIATAAQQADAIAGQVLDAVEQILNQINQATQGAEQQEERSGETATAMNEMNATVLEVARHAQESASHADETRLQAVEGETVVRDVVGAIEQVRLQAESLKANMDNLGVQASGISQIIDVIGDIADQTNLLALNAAIEAARAGDAGRGFAVVADEVRKLAEKTMIATKEVGDSISHIQTGVKKSIEATDNANREIEAGADLAASSGKVLEQIVSLVEANSDQIRSIATASEQQSATSDLINQAVEEISRISAETAHGMTEASGALDDLVEHVRHLRNVIDQMQS